MRYMLKVKFSMALILPGKLLTKPHECLLVEGYTDVISLHQSGIENVVASGGTSLTVDQLRLDKKIHESSYDHL